MSTIQISSGVKRSTRTPTKRTCSASKLMSAKCHKQTFLDRWYPAQRTS